nr:hypothetical protein CFP56_66432 [Quercus suber]
MFTSSSNESGVLCGGMLRCVLWWRFGQDEVEDGRGRKQRKPEIFAKLVLAGALEKIVKASQLEIIELQHSVAELRCLSDKFTYCGY